MVAFIIIASVLAVAIIGSLVFGVKYAHKMAFRPRPRGEQDHFRGTEPGGKTPNPELCRENINRLLNTPNERVSVVSRDGLKLSGYYVRGREGAPVMLCFHGHRSSWQRDFSGIAPILFDHGFNVIFVDQRSHGESEGELVSLGVLEKYDVLAWARYASERFGEESKIVLVGVSMGGASVLGATGLDLPKNVCAVISDSAFSSALEEAVYVGCKGGRMSPVISSITRLSARVYGFKLTEFTPKDALKECELPILLLHSREDALVPYYMAEELFASAKRATLVAFDKGPHVCEGLLEPERYRRAYDNFFLENNI